MKHEVLGDNETTRSGLFFEAIRIIKEMRESTNGEYPKYAVYENVPGAFSSNKGRDFHAVLEALCSVCDDAVSIPEPYDSKRTKACLEQSRRLWETITPSHGEHLTLNTGECPNVARESTLSQILQADAPEKYYLSPRKLARGFVAGQ